MIVTEESISVAHALRKCSAAIISQGERLERLLQSGCTRETYIGASLEHDLLMEEHRALRRLFQESLEG